MCLGARLRVNVRRREEGERGRREESGEEWRLGPCPSLRDTAFGLSQRPRQERAPGPDPVRAKVNMRKEDPVVTVAQGWLLRKAEALRADGP